MKKITVLFLSICLLISSFTQTIVFANNTLEAETIEKAKNANIVQNEFCDDIEQTATRKDFCSIIINMCKALGYSLPTTYSEPFLDTDDADIATAYALGLVKGVSDNMFNYASSVTYEQAATIMHRFLVTGSRDYFDMKVDVDEAIIDSASEWAKDGLRYMIGIGIMNPEVAPSARVSKKDCVIMIWNLYKKVGGQDVIPD